MVDGVHGKQIKRSMRTDIHKHHFPTAGMAVDGHLAVNFHHGDPTLGGRGSSAIPHSPSIAQGVAVRVGPSQRAHTMESSMSRGPDVQNESEAVEENERAMKCIGSGMGDTLVVLDKELGYGIMKATKRDKYICFLHPCNGQTVKWSLFDLNCHRHNKHFPPVGPVPGRRRGKKPTGKWPLKSNIAAENARQKERRDLKRKLDRQENMCKRRLIKGAMVSHAVHDVGDLSLNVKNDIEAAFAKYKSTRGERERLTRSKIDLAVQLEEAAKHQLVESSKNGLCKCCGPQKDKVLTQADTIITSCEVEKKRKCTYVCGKPEADSSQRMLIPVQSVLDSNKQSKDTALEDATCNVPIIELGHAEEENSTHIEEHEEDCSLTLAKDDSINQSDLAQALIPYLGSSISQFPLSRVPSIISTPFIQARLTALFSKLRSLVMPLPLQGLCRGMHGISIPFHMLSDMTLPCHDRHLPPIPLLVQYEAQKIHNEKTMLEMEEGEDLCIPNASVVTMLLKNQMPDLIEDNKITKNDGNTKNGTEKMLANTSGDETQEPLVSTNNLGLTLAQKGKGIEDEDMVVVARRTNFILADRVSEIVERCLWDSQTCREFYVHHFLVEENWKQCESRSKLIAEGQVQEHRAQAVSCIQKGNSERNLLEGVCDQRFVILDVRKL